MIFANDYKNEGNLNKTNFCFAHNPTPTPEQFCLSNFSSSFYFHHCKLLFFYPLRLFVNTFPFCNIFVFSVCVIYSIQVIFHNLSPIPLVLDIKVISIFSVL